MEYCGSIQNYVFVRKRTEQMLGVLILTILMIGIVLITPIVQFGQSEFIYEKSDPEPVGEEIVAFSHEINTPDKIIERLQMVDINPTVVDETSLVSTEFVLTTVPDELAIPDVLSTMTIPSFANGVPPAVVQPSENTGQSDNTIPPAAIEPPEIEIPPETVVPPEITIPPETTEPPEVVIPPETVEPPNTIVPPTVSPTVGFLVNEQGVIYGTDENIASCISDGRLSLPTEGCSSITMDAFYGVSDLVEEVSIPANIVSIEAGAFNHLNGLFWVEVAEGNPSYRSEHGILFSQDMTTVCAVPSGKSNAIEIPSTITRIEPYAFANTQLSMIIMRSCGIVEVSDMVFGGLSTGGVIVLAPPHYMEDYQRIFEGMGVTVQ